MASLLQSSDQALAIQAKVHDTFRKAYQQKFKKELNHLSDVSVISGIGLIDSLDNSFQLISVANGTKSLPYSIARLYKGAVVKDMHAECLVINAFRRFLVQQLQNPNTLVLQNSLTTNKKRLRDNYRLFLYSSETFCGDCCVDEATQAYSGAKPLALFGSDTYPDHKYECGVLRTKPGRIDLPKHLRSLSLSCSDKVALCNLLGIQGKRLFALFQPIYIDFIILSADQKIKERVRRGISFVERLASLQNCSSNEVSKRLKHLKIGEKTKFISRQFKVSHQPKLIFAPLDLSEAKGDSEKLSISLVSYIWLKQCEWLNGRTGLLEGSSLARKDKWRLSEIATDNLYKASDQEFQNDEFKYTAMKENLKLMFGHWTNNHKQKLEESSSLLKRPPDYSPGKLAHHP